ncbi:YfiR family protein [Carboxylicivirga marina]|uniref:YfiR family protein n=1 Tax=Carboxylicivirga marina TaxID=2800988 RepID=UPI00259A9C65|nr:YfiR family protein [uncultured Carboxylicivirga sp.]
MKTLIISLFLFVNISYINGQTMKKQEELKAIYIFNFIKLIDWQKQEDLKVGVVGNSQVLLSLKKIADRTSNSFELVKISQKELIKECSIIYIPSAQSRNLPMISSEVNTLPVLLVSDEVQLLNEGADIAFNLQGDQLKYYISKTNLDQSNITYSSRLLRLGEVIDM